MCARGLFLRAAMGGVSHRPWRCLGFCCCLCLCLCFLPLAFALAFQLLMYRAVKRAEHRSLTRPKSSPCLSEASLGCGTVKVPMCRVRRGAEGTGAAQPRRLAPGDGGLTRASGARPSGRLRRSPALRAVVLTFDKTKVSRANSAEALFFANQLKPSESGERREAEQVQSFRPLRVRVPF